MNLKSAYKILRFFDTHIDIFHTQKFLRLNSTFCKLLMHMRKKLYLPTFSNILQKVKSYLFFEYTFILHFFLFLLKFHNKYKI
jgi:hypothetical protein